MEGLIEEGKEMMGEDMDDDVMDAALISVAQKVEHYEIASYGTVRTWPSCSATSRRRACSSRRWTRRARRTSC
jgi:ferritin-like metal-binding protein YciE